MCYPGQEQQSQAERQQHDDLEVQDGYGRVRGVRDVQHRGSGRQEKQQQRKQQGHCQARKLCMCLIEATATAASGGSHDVLKQLYVQECCATSGSGYKCR